MALLYFILVGAIAGWLGGQIMRGSGFGLIGNIVVGVIGAIIGGLVFDFLDISTGGGMLGSIITALVGSVILLWVASLLNKK